ncbi:MAG: P-loop NTPase family protein [Acidimicrobiales bacterium]
MAETETSSSSSAPDALSSPSGPEAAELDTAPESSRAPERVLVVGLSCSGKSTLARRLGEVLDCPHVELDALYWEPGWVEADVEVFRARVEAATAGDRWVTCGNYWSKLGPYLWPRADTVVWLDLPLWLIEVRVLRRTLVRVLGRRRLWNGNRERLVNLWAKDALWRFNLRHHGRISARYEAAMADPKWANVDFHRLRSPGQVKLLLARVTDQARGRA